MQLHPELLRRLLEEMIVGVGVEEVGGPEPPIAFWSAASFSGGSVFMASGTHFAQTASRPGSLVAFPFSKSELRS